MEIDDESKVMKITNKKKMTATWQREAVAWLRGKAAEQAQNNERWPEHARCYPSWTERVETAQRLADELEREAEEGVVFHVTPAIKEGCDHNWIDGEDGNPERCVKCGMSFTRYIFCCYP